MFAEEKKIDFSKSEEKILQFWEENQIFEKSVEQRKDNQLYSFYDGPPFATGLPHYGHLLVSIIKDVVLRYQTMRGFFVPRRFGWDCHGLPVEHEVEKAKKQSGGAIVADKGIAHFNEACRSIVLRYTKEWQDIVSRVGRWVDFKHTYRTMDRDFMESVWWVFKELYDQGLVYEGFKVMPFSPQLGTPLSNFEATSNYKEVDDPALTVMFSLVDDPDVKILAWTTTPWTLISNLALAVGHDVNYVKIKDNKDNCKYILAKERLSAYYKHAEDYEILEEFKGDKLKGRKYQPLLPYFANRTELGAFRIIVADFVEVEEGTGIVHMAPAFGEADFDACKKEGIELVCPVDSHGRFSDEIGDYKGRAVKDCDKEIIKKLKTENKVFRHATVKHRYPFCWRSDTPLIYKVMHTWFVHVEKIKDKLLDANKKIRWVPDYIKFGRFGKWLEGARDWNISRNRFWGTPIPLWKSDDGEIVAIGSVAELEGLTGQKIDDLHRHFIDDLTFEKEGKIFRRIPEVFDCWFESGSMPYAQNHYPFENKDLIENHFPAHFIAEALDQTRGWFYTLTVLSAALFDKPAFENVIVFGLILAEDGNKMSKRLRNYPDPMELIHKYGADALRLYLLHSPAVKGESLCFSEKGVEHVLRKILIPLWNAYNGFFITYARINKWLPSRNDFKPTNVIDKWILSLLNKLIINIEKGLEEYDLSRAVDPLIGFIDQLTNWYIRRSRRRFWSEEESADRDDAFHTLYIVLLELSKITAPFIPFISEKIYNNLRSENHPESVHLCDYPKYRSNLRDENLEEAMEAIQNVVSLGHALRKEQKIKVRQPLQTLSIAVAKKERLEFLRSEQKLIEEELNVKNVEFYDDETKFVELRAKPNFRVLGKKVGKQMRKVQEIISKFDQKQLKDLMEGNNLSIDVNGETIVLQSEDVDVDRVVHEGMVAANIGEISIALDVNLTDELLEEGLMREIINKISTMRRDANFEVCDRIKILIDSTPKVKQCVEKFYDYICNEVLAIDMSFQSCEGTEWDLNGEKAIICIKKV